MNSKQHGLLWLLTCLGGITGQSGVEADEPPDGQTLYPAGSQQSFVGPEEYFTGDVQVDLLFPGNDTAHFSGAYVTFQPGARTAWHLHPAGQHMIVTNGVALTAGYRPAVRLRASHQYLLAKPPVWGPVRARHFGLSKS